MSVAYSKTECPLVKELSNCLKENSHCGIVSCLTRIKTDEKCLQRIFDNGGGCLLVELLRYRNTKVMDTTLSILANACLLSHVREKMEGTKIAPYVVWIAKNLESGETMHCRACRLMGNLSESYNHARSLCEAGAVSALTEILRSRANAQTLGMAVRAVRNIWTINESGREEILEACTIREITSLLVRSRKNLLERETDAKYAELAESCLKALYVFADCTDPRTCEQMRGEKGIHGYRCIVDYCRASNKTAIKCLYKLCLYAGRRPDLGNSGAIECLVENLRSRGCTSSRAWSGEDRLNLTAGVSSSSTSFWESLVSLCMFCREAVNRAKIRRGSGLEAILALLNEVRNERYHPMLLHALAQFICDDLSIEIMVKNGIVDVLVDKLKKMTLDKTRTANEKGMENDAKYGKKRSADTSPCRRASDIKHNRTGYQYGRFSLDYPREDWSPGGTSTSYSSPPSTPPLLTYETNSDIDENADDNYSPICSDNEWLENEDTTDIPDDEELSGRGRIGGSRDETSLEPDDFMKAESNENFDDNYQEERGGAQESSSILSLLNMLSHSAVPIDRLSDITTVRALAGYIASTKNGRATVILTRIIRNRAYFVPLLLQGFVLEAQTLYGADHYARALRDTAETGGAFGEMATLLLRGQDTHKTIVAVSIPFVIKSREKLRILLKYHGGLELIYRVVEQPQNSMYEDAVLAICKLADSLDVSTPLTNENEEEDENEVEARCVNVFQTNTSHGDETKHVDEAKNEDPTTSDEVIFELDDGTSVRAKRNLICEKSVVFAAMLEGSFIESGKNRVRLRKATRDGLAALLVAANDNFDLREEKIEAILDAVILADKFLMPEVSERLTEISMSRLDHENICRAWHWSRTNSCHEFRNCCVKMFLTAAMSRKHRLEAFRDFHGTTSFRDFVKDTRDIIDHSLALLRV